MSEFFTFDIASGITICFTAYAVYLQRQELKLQREEITLNRKELEGQKEQTKRLADLTEQTAKATRLQAEIDFCKKIECRMVYINQSHNQKIEYKHLYEQIKNYLKPDSELYDYYLSESSPFTVLCEKSKMVSDR